MPPEEAKATVAPASKQPTDEELKRLMALAAEALANRAEKQEAEAKQQRQEKSAAAAITALSRSYPKNLWILPRPLAAQPKVRIAKDVYIAFKNGKATVDNARDEQLVRDALSNMRIRIFDEDSPKPFVIKSISWATNSSEAFQVASDRLPRS